MKKKDPFSSSWDEARKKDFLNLVRIGQAREVYFKVMTDSKRSAIELAERICEELSYISKVIIYDNCVEIRYSDTVILFPIQVDMQTPWRPYSNTDVDFTRQ